MAGGVILVAILTMAFNVVSVKVNGESYSEEISINGYQVLVGLTTAEYFDTGFLGVGLAIMMVLSIVIAVKAILGQDESFDKNLATAIACVVAFTVVYMCVGVSTVSSLGDQLAPLTDTARVIVMTGAVIPFVFSTSIAVAYVLIKKLVFEREKTEKVVEAKQKPTAYEDVTESILKYKELMDAGVITEEEFSAIKKDLLK